MTTTPHSQPIIDAELILSNLPGHIYWHDTNGAVLGCNQQQAADLGFQSPADLIGKTMPAFRNQNDATMLKSNNDEVIRTGKSQLFE